MRFGSLNRFLGKFKLYISLSTLLSVPFVVQTFTAVSLVGYFSYRNGHTAVNNLATQLRSEISKRIYQKLDSYLAIPHQINQTNLQAVKLGLLNLENFEKTGQYFWNQLQVFNVGYINFGNTRGEFIGAGLEEGYVRVSEKLANSAYKIISVDDNGKRQSVVTVKPNGNPNNASWYSDAVRKNKPTWSNIYNWQDSPDIIAISSSYPVYNSNQQLIGVIGVDLILSEISTFLRNIRISPEAYTFIIERDGMLVASSSEEPVYKIRNGRAKRIQASQFNTPLIKQTATYLNKKFSSLEKITQTTQLDFKFNHQKHFIQVTPWQDKYGLDWLIVVVVPESDFMAEIKTNNQATVFLCLLTLGLAIIIGVLTSRSIAAPIKQLSVAAEILASRTVDSDFDINEFHKNTQTHRIKELVILSNLFNSMAQKIHTAFQALENVNNQLESRVHERTNELEAALKKREQAEIALTEALITAKTASQAKSEFLSKVSHELRTPLNIILGFTQVIERDNLSQEQQNSINIINRSGNHLLQLINDVLSMSKIEAGKVMIQETCFDLLDCLNYLNEMFQGKAKSKKLKLTFQLNSKLPKYIKADENKLRQILMNLLNNAIKFTNKGSVTLKVNFDNHFSNILYFEVEDTGAGIAEVELDNIFVPFVQSHAGRQSIEGTGLGLAITQKFIQAMGGDISVKSIYNQGSVFSFQIPIHLVNDSQFQKSKISHMRVIGIEKNQPKYRILIVEDVVENRFLLTKMLELVGFEVSTAANGLEAIQKCKTYQPHLVCLDMLMPVMDGYEAARIIHRERVNHSPIIIAITANAFEEQRAAIFAAGCDDLIYKPFTEEILLEKIAQHLRVSYIYEQNNYQPEVTETPTQFVEITSDDLSVMSREWLLELAEAAKKLDDKLVLKLINQIPVSEARLSKGLKDLVDNFRLDIILDLVTNIMT